jgi:hypothetical protein
MHLLPLAATAAGSAAAGTAAATAAGATAMGFSAVGAIPAIAGGASLAGAGAGAGMLASAMKFGTILQGVGALAGGMGEKASSEFEAEQMRAAAGNERASSQRASAEIRRQTRLDQSRLQAVSAASGGGAGDPTVVDLAGDLEEDGEYRRLTALYEGEERARGLEAGASAKKVQGRQAMMGGLVGAAGTILENADSIYDRFSGKRKGRRSASYGMRTFSNA